MGSGGEVGKPSELSGGADVSLYTPMRPAGAGKVISMRLVFLLLALLVVPASAQGLVQQYRQQQSERDRTLVICTVIKQYEEAKYWSTDQDSRLRYMITPQSVQGTPSGCREQHRGANTNA